MRVFHSPPQCSYEHGVNMCTSAALRMCMTILEEDVPEDFGALVNQVMRVACREHIRFKGEPVSVSEIVKQIVPKYVTSVEYCICETGCSEVDSDGKPVSFMITRDLLIPCLDGGGNVTTGKHPKP
jgi:hypothetical protein